MKIEHSFARALLPLAAVTLLVACGSNGTREPLTTPAPPAETPEQPPAGDNGHSGPPPECAYDETPLAVGTGVTRLDATRFDQCEGSVQLAQAEVVDEASASDGTWLAPVVAGDYLEYTLWVERSGLFDVDVQAEAATGWRIDNGVQAEPVDFGAGPVYLSDGLQVIRLSLQEGESGLDELTLTYTEALVLEPHATVADMGIGINLGNTLDAYPNEGDWALPAQEVYLQDFKTAGFRHVRIPATWDDHTGDSPPYAVSQSRMDRTEEIVDWALAQGYYVTLNAHHERWLWRDGHDPARLARFEAIWAQIAERFQHKSSRLLFEILNEPIGMTADEVTTLNAAILPIIRDTNPERLVVIAGHDYTGVGTLADLVLPEDDFLIGNFHSYDPWDFAGQCLRRWGSQADRDELAGIYATAKAWSEARGVPVMLNEFGAAKYDHTASENVCELEDRLAYIEAHVTFATEAGIAATFWDDGESFSTYDRANRAWGPEKDILVAPNP